MLVLSGLSESGSLLGSRDGCRSPWETASDYERGTSFHQVERSAEKLAGTSRHREEVSLVESVLCLADRIILPRSVVFSFWTYTLDLVESLLKPKSISYARIDGNLSGARREEAIQRFQTNESVRVILVSITCGGTG